MVGIISKSLKNKIFEVAQFGKDRGNGTRESLNQIMILEFPRNNIHTFLEEMECRHLYQNKMGKNWVEKNIEERHHYKFLYHGLLHKINATKYFHNEGIESRKLIVFSDDCISTIQLMVREEEVGLYVHMRSSDAINLLAPDIMALTGILNEVILTHQIAPEDRRIVIHITFGSLHIYQEDLEIAKEVGVSHSGEMVYDDARRSYL